eukprot:TRINITY_DN811_c0_g2_i1.p2 TRINITY_DN811_c0_g2~~TRINITY_DN811_c0_g2_i1.p2  ORF type:complete len:161 (+),score=51.21 TRINITY_DN811_c0_g2_i1:122-604(+)
MTQTNEPASAKGGLLDGQMDWGEENGGGVFEIVNVKPCCDGYCCVTWWCCGCLNSCQLFSWALDQPCSIVNHVLPLMCLPMCCFVRHAVRNKLQVPAGGPMEGLAGDCVCATFCGPCVFCQQLRGAHKVGGKESWDFFGHMEINVYDKNMKSFPPFTPMH